MSAPTKAAIGLPKRKTGLERISGDNIPAAADNMAAELDVGITFRTSEEFRTRYKRAAVDHGCSMKEILHESFELWLASKQ